MYLINYVGVKTLTIRWRIPSWTRTTLGE